MLLAGNGQPGVMDSSEAAISGIHQAALVGRVVQRDAVLSEGWGTGIAEKHQDHSSLSYPLWAKAVHLIPHR